MGNASTICCDKTGTLTTNRMTVVRVYASKTDFKEPYAARITLSAEMADGIGMAAALNSQTKSEYSVRGNELPAQQGNKVQYPMLDEVSVQSQPDRVRLSAVCRPDMPASASTVSSNDAGELIYQGAMSHSGMCLVPSYHTQLYPFSSQKKRMSTIIRLSNGTFRLFVKGAPELLLPMCVAQQCNGGTEPISQRERVCSSFYHNLSGL